MRLYQANARTFLFIRLAKTHNKKITIPDF